MKNTCKKKKCTRSKYSTYNKFSVFLTRKKMKNSGKFATFLLNRFVHSNETWEHIKSEELLKIGVSEKNKFSEWRDYAIKQGILIWEGRNKDTNYQTSRYKPGHAILKYINEEKSKFNVLATMTNISYIDEKHTIEIQKQSAEIQKQSERIDKLEKILLKAFPPDTPERRKIIFNHYADEEKCIDLLKN